MNRFTLALGIALYLVEASVATAIIATNDQRESPWLTIALAVSAGAAFVVSGLVALVRRPDNRTGVYLAATGYLWFLAALTESDIAWVFTVGFVLGNLTWVAFSALVLAYPTGRLETRLERVVPPALGVGLVVPAFLAALLDSRPLPDCNACPESAIAIADLTAAGTVLDVFTTLVGLSIIAVVVYVLVRRWRRASSASRRLLWPVLGAGIATLVTVGLVVIANQVSTTVAGWLQPLFLVSFAAVPFAFLFGILRTRLARSSVSDLVVALDQGVPLRDALAKALSDPTLDIVYWLDWRRGLGGSGWVDAQGRAVPDIPADSTRAVRLVERGGERVATLLYDPALDAEPELLDAVTSAAGMALHNERLHAELRAEVTFMNTVTNTAPSLLVNVGTDGRIRNINSAALAASGFDDQEVVRGQYFWDVFIDAGEREEMRHRFAAAAPEFAAAEYENRFTNNRGEKLVIYWRSAPVENERGRVLSIVAGGLDITERDRMEKEIRASRVRIVAAGDEARQQLERNLHDGAQQRLVALSVALRLAEAKLGDDPEAAARIVAGAREELAVALDELRELARGIHPAVLTDRGLAPAVEALAVRAPVPVDVEVVSGRLPTVVEAASYYVVAEALTNVAKYAKASGANVQVTREDGLVVIEVTDDGEGGADPAAGTGLRGLADRVAALDGTLVVESPRGRGTRVRAEIPLAESGAPQ